MKYLISVVCAEEEVIDGGLFYRQLVVRGNCGEQPTSGGPETIFVNY